MSTVELASSFIEGAPPGEVCVQTRPKSIPCSFSVLLQKQIANTGFYSFPMSLPVPSPSSPDTQHPTPIQHFPASTPNKTHAKHPETQTSRPLPPKRAI